MPLVPLQQLPHLLEMPSEQRQKLLGGLNLTPKPRLLELYKDMMDLTQKMNELLARETPSPPTSLPPQRRSARLASKRAKLY